MTSYAGKENQCRNFAPNIFNKNKCQNCFKPRETHLLSDKDLNKATPIYCGWLLLAPIGTDFDNPMHRARKWQRRYFILFEHGALRYALDDNANTLPQGTINMNQCSDVVHAEKITGQKYSLCIYHPDMKYFIRSENREETGGWLEQLIIFPQTVKQDALNKKRFTRRFGSTKTPSSPTPTDDANKKAQTITYEESRSPRVESPRLESPRDKVFSPSEPVEKSINIHENEKRPNADIKRGRSISRKSTDMKQGTQTLETQRPLRRAKSLDRDAHDMNDITIESPNQRKGWLMKRGNTTKETWTKHWFVLSSNVLKYYQDPSAEEFSHPDGEVNLANVSKVDEVEMDRNYGFSIHTKDDEETVLAAVTMGIRRNWMRAIDKSLETANVQAPKQNAEKENQPVVFDEKMVETTMLRRARMRQRRKMGRSRTYDFAELRSACPATVDTPPPEDDRRPAELELHRPIEKSDLTLPIKNISRHEKHEKQEERKVEENGIKSPELHKREILTSPRTPSPRTPKSDDAKVTRKQPLTQQMLDQVDGQWEKIEKFDIFSKILSKSKSGKSVPHIKDSQTATVCNSLKSEVDLMERQIEKGQREFCDFLNDHTNKVENEALSNHEDALKGAGNNAKTKSQPAEDSNTSYNSADSDKIRALEIAHRCAMEENKRLRDEIVQSHLSREQESNRMQSKIKNLKTELSVVSKRSRMGKSSLKSENTDRSFKDKVSELEAEMEDTGQMIAARLTALENPRRKDTDDSDEAGSSSSCSSINQLVKQGKGEDGKSEARKKVIDLDTSHVRFAESIKTLQEARSSAELGTTAVQEAFNVNKATVLSLQKKLLEDQKNWSSVKKCLQELRGKVAEIQNDKYTDPQHVLPFLESVLDDTLQMIEKGGVNDVDDTDPGQAALGSMKKKTKTQDPKELERETLEKLKTLSEKLKTTDANSQFGSNHSLPTTSSSSSLAAVESQFEKLPLDQREKLFAEQLSHEAMIVAEMAGALERYTGGKNADISQSLLHSDTQDIFPENGKYENRSGLLQHAGIVAEKVLLESRLISELSKLQSTSNLQRVRHEFKSSSLPPSGAHGKMNQESWSSHQGMVADTASLSLVQAQVNYMLHVYNDRIARLAHDVKEAQHRADIFQEKLHELVHACKTRDIELVSQLAVEVDTKASLALTVEDLPEWRQQVDYGMLHGAQASISNIDLQVEASFFAKLSQDIACMSSDSSNLSKIGTRILELDMSLSRILKPSVIGEHASTIAYEAISQAQLLFLSRRISKDYEEEIIKMKSAVRKQSEHCENIQQKLRDIENGDAAKMQELTNEHKQKVERLRQQLTLVEKARQEMSSDMDDKLNKLSEKQQREMERSEARHKQETKNLHQEFAGSKSRLEEKVKDHVKEISQLKNNLREIRKSHEEQIKETKRNFEDELNEERKESRRKVDSISSGDAEKMEKMQSLPHTVRASSSGIPRLSRSRPLGLRSRHVDLHCVSHAEFREKLESLVASHEEEIKDLEEHKERELKRLQEKHETEIENERSDKDQAVKDVEDKWEEVLKEKQSLLDSIQQEKSKESKVQHETEMSELQSFFEQSFSEFEESHKNQLEELAKQYRQDVKRLEEEKAQEMEDDVTSTKMAIMSMKKHYQDDLAKLKTLPSEASEQNPELQNQVDDLKRELETLSELYGIKCVDITKNEDEIKALEERLMDVEENNQVLKDQNEELSQKIEEEMKSTPLVMKNEESDDVNRLRVELGAKKTQVSILQRQIESLKQHVAMTLQGRGFLRRGDRQMLTSKGYDIMKSKSHSDFISLEEMPTKGVARRSSDRRSRATLQEN